ncbi:ADP-ribosylglycohydrolase family protein [Kibdelosporangium lantanae]
MPHLRNALDSLTGLAVGDAFGAQIHLPGDHPTIRNRELPAATWRWTDDTEMACSVLAVLTAHDGVDPDTLAQMFAGHFDPDRGYGSGVERQLLAIRRGESWRSVSTSVFGGAGSWGNGAAMRVAPLGAYFHDDPDRVLAEAHTSAIVTHAHPEGIAGAVAVAVAAALAAGTALTGSSFLAEVARNTPEGEVREGIQLAADLTPGNPPDIPQPGPAASNIAPRPGPTDPPNIAPQPDPANPPNIAPQPASANLPNIALQLGTGVRTSAPDTIPLSLWIAANHMAAFEEAMWTVAAVASDVDTVAAIVGGVIAARTTVAGIPEHWLAATEPLPDWVPRWSDAVGRGG